MAARSHRQYVRYSDGRGFYPGGDDRHFEAQGNQCGHGVARTCFAGSNRCAAASFRPTSSMTITRNYGETAKDKSNELLWHMLIAVVSVSVLIALTLGLRESLIVFIAIPVTLALTLTVFYLYGYTLNRITLFALIFSIGILVDDAIVVVENIVRHWRMPANHGRPPFEVAIEAVDEVGNPDHSGHPRRDCSHFAHGVRRRIDGALHAADPDRRQRSDDLFAARGFRGHALGRGADPQTEQRAARWRAVRIL